MFSMNLCFPFQAAVTSSIEQGTFAQEQVEETASQDSKSDIVVRTPPSKNGVINSSAPLTLVGSLATLGTLNASAHNLSGASTAPVILSGLTSVRGVLEDAGAVVSSSPINISNSAKEEANANFPGRRSSPALAETRLKGIGRVFPEENSALPDINERIAHYGLIVNQAAAISFAIPFKHYKATSAVAA
ncbi:hypothetical protein F0562_022656 [Nyssa sinensis]|uniref:Uncharacterized protein n=1 Tax=Nyssa sinensis TaxID=561372 RepID=A0A5J5BFH8_9ASTE|nr:hypothetical protein F0562_022656 [Nyssa sinensis]